MISDLFQLADDGRSIDANPHECPYFLRAAKKPLSSAAAASSIMPV